MLKQLICVGLAVSLGASPLVVNAQNLDNTFSALLGGSGVATFNSPGGFSSQARSGFSAGGVEVRIPRVGATTPQLLSITPPRITAGCGGISAHFGGFSFISGAEFSALLKQIASGAALGFVTSLVMKTLCPPCEAIVQELKTTAAQAAKMMKDACQWGAEKGASFRQGLTGSANLDMNCAQIVANENKAADSLQGWTNSCNTIAKAGSWLRSNLPAEDTTTAAGKAQAAANTAALACGAGFGNQTWAILGAFDLAPSSATAEQLEDSYKRKLLLLNILGAELGPTGGLQEASCSYADRETFDMRVYLATNPADASHYCAPPADSKLLTGIFLCGAPDTSGKVAAGTSERVKGYCAAYFAKAPAATLVSTSLWTCADNKTDCNVLVASPARNVVTGEGFMVAVNRLLMEAVARVRNGTGFDDPTGRQIMQLIQVAPYPLYQAINASAVYPAAGADLMDSMSILVGEQFAYALLDESLRITNRQGTGTCNLSRMQASKMLDFITQLRGEAQDRKEVIGANFTLQQGITRQIHEINLAIQQQTMSEDLLGAGRLTESINNAVTPLGRGASAPSPGPATPPVVGAAP